MQHPNVEIRMMNGARICYSFITVLLLLSSVPAYPLSIGWSVFQGGDGLSESVSGNYYLLKSTLSPSHGTPAATGGAAGYSLTAHIFAHETGTVIIPQPTLNVVRNTDGTATVSWPILSTGYVVEQSSTLSPGSWASAPYGINHNGVIRWFTVQPTASSLFFRLRKL